MQPEPSTVRHVYVHVPFCAAKCNYCGFYSEPAGTEKMRAYVEAVEMELRWFVEGHARSWPPTPNGRDGARPSKTHPTTIFFGGGTPSLLPVNLMRLLLEAVGGARPPGAPPPAEFTIECNPATISDEKARLCREFGINRISLGVQALDDAMLKIIGRIHSREAALTSFEQLRAAGFDNINLDLMFGLPGQTPAHWEQTLRETVALQPEHISTYCLILEEDTPFWSLLQQGHIRPDAEQERAMYETAIETLQAAGYHQYEISNFAKPGRECAHNIAYWQVEDYLGLGPSACSTIGDRRWQNIPDTDRYVAAISNQQSAISFEETITPELRAAERAAFGMRMTAGVPAELVRGRWDRQIAELFSAELVQWRNGRLQPTKRGILFADDVASEFV